MMLLSGHRERVLPAGSWSDARNPGSRLIVSSRRTLVSDSKGIEGTLATPWFQCGFEFEVPMTVLP
jgi:hypothetical protein